MNGRISSSYISSVSSYSANMSFQSLCSAPSHSFIKLGISSKRSKSPVNLIIFSSFRGSAFRLCSIRMWSRSDFDTWSKSLSNPICGYLYILIILWSRSTVVDKTFFGYNLRSGYACIPESAHTCPSSLQSTSPTFTNPYKLDEISLKTLLIPIHGGQRKAVVVQLMSQGRVRFFLIFSSNSSCDPKRVYSVVNLCLIHLWIAMALFSPSYTSPSIPCFLV